MKWISGGSRIQTPAPAYAKLSYAHGDRITAIFHYLFIYLTHDHKYLDKYKVGAAHRAAAHRAITVNLDPMLKKKTNRNYFKICADFCCERMAFVFIKRVKRSANFLQLSI